MKNTINRSFKLNMQMLMDVLEDVCVISIGNCQWEERMGSVIQINTKQEWQKVYNDVSDVFKRYLAWDRDLYFGRTFCRAMKKNLT